MDASYSNHCFFGAIAVALTTAVAITSEVRASTCTFIKQISNEKIYFGDIFQITKHGCPILQSLFIFFLITMVQLNIEIELCKKCSEFAPILTITFPIAFKIKQNKIICEAILFATQIPKMLLKKDI